MVISERLYNKCMDILHILVDYFALCRPSFFTVDCMQLIDKISQLATFDVRNGSNLFDSDFPKARFLSTKYQRNLHP